MWQRIFVFTTLTLGLVACGPKAPPSSVESNASLCEILKQKIEAEDYNTTDPATMKRKTTVDQAKLIKEYDAYSCPEIVDSAPPP